jgi:hypothetical protein
MKPNPPAKILAIAFVVALVAALTGAYYFWERYERSHPAQQIVLGEKTPQRIRDSARVEARELLKSIPSDASRWYGGVTATSENANILVRDPLGRRTGCIAGELFLEAGEVDRWQGEWPGNRRNEGVYHSVVVARGNDGWYELEISAAAPGEYKLDVVISGPDSAQLRRYAALGLLDTGFIDTYRFRYGSPMFPADSLEKAVSLETLRQLVLAFYRTGHLGGRRTRDSLEAPIDRAEVAIRTGNLQQAQAHLDSLLSNLSDAESVYGILEENAKLLRSDCRKMRKQLTTDPSK